MARNERRQLSRRLEGYRVDQRGVEPCDDGLCLHVQCSLCNPDAKPSIYGMYTLPTGRNEQPPLIRKDNA